MQEGTAARTTGKKVRPPKMPEPDDFTLIYDGKDIYLAADGVKIANHIPRSLPGPFGVVAICAHQRISGLEVNQWQLSLAPQC